MVWLQLGQPADMAAQVRFYTQVSEKQLPVNHTFQLQYIVEGDADIRDLRIPPLPDFRVLEIFENNSTNTRPGSLEPVHVYSKVLVLSPKRSGRFQIPGASAKIGGKIRRSDPVQVMVQEGTVPGASGQASDPSMVIPLEENSELAPGEDAASRIAGNLFLRVETSRKTCYVGEGLMATYKLYSRLNASSQVLRRPSLTGFSVTEMVDAYDSRPVIETLNGTPYYVNLIRKVQLFPLQAGLYMLDPAEVESVIHFIKWKEGVRKARLPFDYTIHLRTDPVPVRVLPLPADKQPPDFRGAVGQFSISTQVMGQAQHAGDLVKIRVRVEGTGNIPLLTAPLVKWPRGVDTADPRVMEEVNQYLFPLHGTKTFEYAFVAPDTGDYTIPSIRLPYYDPLQKVYKTALTEPQTLHIVPGRKREKVVQAVDADKDAGTTLQWTWFSLLALLILSWIGYQVIQARKSAKVVGKEYNNPSGELPGRGAPQEDLLKNAREALQSARPEPFYEALQEAVWTALARRFGLSPSARNRQQLEARVQPGSAEQPYVAALCRILDECEWALYVPGYQARERQSLLQEATDIFREASGGEPADAG